MSASTIGTICLVIALLSAVVVLVAAAVEPRRPTARRWFTALLGVLAVASIAAYPRFGHMRGAIGPIHPHEQFHFFVGSKYLDEVRYDGLYLATVAAAAEESDGRYPNNDLRDLTDFETRPATEMAEQAEAVKARFSKERWAAFRGDVDAMEHEVRARVRSIVTDHGNTGSPSWAAVASMFTATIPLSHGSAVFFAMLDPALLLLLIATTWRAFGARTAFLVAIFAFLPVRAYAYLGGSILRVDWLFAVGMTACMVGLRRFRTAGLMLAYAISSKPFTAVIALALGVRFLVDARHRRRLAPEHLTLVLSAVVGLAFWVSVSAAVFGGFDIWREYIERILITLHEGYYRSQYSMRDIYLQATAHPLTFLFDPAPRRVQASLNGVDIADHAVGFLVARVVVLAALYAAASRHDVLFSVWIGALSVFVGFVTNMYYWQLWLVLALAAGRAGSPRRNQIYVAAGLAILGIDWLPEILGWHRNLHGYFGSFWLAWLVIATVGTELVLGLRARRVDGGVSGVAGSRSDAPAG